MAVVDNPGFGDNKGDDNPPKAEQEKKEEGGSIVTMLTGWMEHPYAITAIAIVTSITAIISISTAASAYSTLVRQNGASPSG